MSFVTLSAVSILIGIFHTGKFCFRVPFFKKLLLRNYVADFVEICNVYARKAIIEAAKRIINSAKVCHSYSDLNFGVTFFGTQCIYSRELQLRLKLTGEASLAHDVNIKDQISNSHCCSMNRLGTNA